MGWMDGKNIRKKGGRVFSLTRQARSSSQRDPGEAAHVTHDVTHRPTYEVGLGGSFNLVSPPFFFLELPSSSSSSVQPYLLL
jgi:hypothetical protein